MLPANELYEYNIWFLSLVDVDTGPNQWNIFQLFITKIFNLFSKDGIVMTVGNEDIIDGVGGSSLDLENKVDDEDNNEDSKDANIESDCVITEHLHNIRVKIEGTKVTEDCLIEVWGVTVEIKNRATAEESVVSQAEPRLWLDHLIEKPNWYDLHPVVIKFQWL